MVKKLTMADVVIHEPPAWTPKRCMCGNRIYQDEEYCRGCKWQMLPHSEQAPTHPPLHDAEGRTNCACCRRMLPSARIEQACKYCKFCEEHIRSL